MTDTGQKTTLQRIEQYRDRWSTMEASSGLVELSERLSVEKLRALDPFREFKDPLLKNMAPDVSVAVWKPGSVLFEEGSYIDIAFFVLEGEVDLFLSGTRAAPSFESTRTAYVPRPASGDSDRTVFEQMVDRQDAATLKFLNTLDMDLPADGRMRIGPGELFGDIGAMSGWPQSITARTASTAKLIQIRVPALRLIRRRSPEFKERLNQAYRSRALMSQLKATPLLNGTSDHVLQTLAQQVELVSLEPGQTLVNQGDGADALYLVRSGFLKLSQKVGQESLTATYLSKGMTLGEAEILLEGVSSWTASAISVEYAEVVKISAGLLQEVLADNPAVRQGLWQSGIQRIKEMGVAQRDAQRPQLVNMALETGLIQGNSVLVIDLNRCTHCDDCVKGCASTHHGTPRFVREGEKVGSMLVAKACYHCRDPLCLVGCPTGAIRRPGFGDSVAVNEAPVYRVR